MEILNTTPGEYDHFLAFMIGLIAVLFLILTIGALMVEETVLSIVFACCGLLCVWGIYATATADFMKTPTKHDVLITNMAAFDTSKYKIVEQRGKVFTVEEVAASE